VFSFCYSALLLDEKLTFGKANKKKNDFFPQMVDPCTVELFASRKRGMMLLKTSLRRFYEVENS
jgi:hypothetical protein